jgi:hypothetical protein
MRNSIIFEFNSNFNLSQVYFSNFNRRSLFPFIPT